MVAERMADIGLPLLAWQQTVLEHALQLDAGRWQHPIVGMTVSRQNGKTRILLARILAELFWMRRTRRVLHTAQDRAVPRELFLEMEAIIDQTPRMRRQVKTIRHHAGQESITLRNGVQYRILAPRQERFRSWPASLVCFDEAREHRTLELGEAARYTLATAARPQVWYVSNAGDPASIRLNTLRARGVAAAEDPDTDPDMCYLEWSAPTDDPYDLAGWEQANPSLGLLLPPESVLSELRDAEGTGDLTGFLTERMCRWVEVTSRVAIPPVAWERCGATRQPRKFTEKDRIVLTVELYPDRQSAAIVAAAVRGEKTYAAVLRSWSEDDLIEEREIADELREHVTRLRPERIGFDPLTSAGVAAHLQARWPDKLQPISGAAWVTACGQLWDAVTAGRLVHMNDPDLTAQVQAAARRDVGDGTWRISRVDSGQPIPSVIALARAVHLAYRPRVVPQVL